MKALKNNYIFLQIISVLTLVVVITGATFAYFSASAATNANDIKGRTYQLSLGLTVEKVNPATVPAKGDKLIPLDENNISTAVNAGCIDSNSYAVCNIYKLTFNNGGSESITLSGELTPTQNNFTSLYYNATAINGAKSTLTAGTLLSGNTEATTGFTNLVIPSGTSTMYLMLYILNDPDNNQPNDQAKSFNGTLTLTDTRSSSGVVKATFTVS